MGDNYVVVEEDRIWRDDLFQTQVPSGRRSQITIDPKKRASVRRYECAELCRDSFRRAGVDIHELEGLGRSFQ